MILPVGMYGLTCPLAALFKCSFLIRTEISFSQTGAMVHSPQTVLFAMAPQG